ncbi:MAG: hypothetical protein ABJO27_19920 [Pseudoruegeria sp.]
MQAELMIIMANSTKPPAVNGGLGLGDIYALHDHGSLIEALTASGYP